MAQARPSHCLNCAQPVEHRFCPHCGQENRDYRESLWPLLGDLAEELFQLESRVWRSLAALLFRPGLLTVEHNAGRRVRYTSPLRLYLLLGALFFTVVALRPVSRLEPIDVRVEPSVSSKSPPLWVQTLLIKSAELQKVGGVETARRIRPSLEANMPRAFAVLVPVVALLFKLFYRRRFYVEHLTHSLHLSAFGFVMMLPEELSHSRWLALTCASAVAGYALLATRRVYGESWRRTVAKLSAIMLLYILCAALVVIPLFFIAIMST
jgi:hypothetical protein